MKLTHIQECKEHFQKNSIKVLREEDVNFLKYYIKSIYKHGGLGNKQCNLLESNGFTFYIGEHTLYNPDIYAKQQFKVQNKPKNKNWLNVSNTVSFLSNNGIDMNFLYFLQNPKNVNNNVLMHETLEQFKTYNNCFGAKLFPK